MTRINDILKSTDKPDGKSKIFEYFNGPKAFATHAVPVTPIDDEFRECDLATRARASSTSGGGQQASSQPVQSSVRPAAQKWRMLTEVEDNRGQEEERSAKKRRRRKWKCETISWEVHVPGSPPLGSYSNTGTPFGGN
ncbi:hypothetical protein NEUTE1DRAFT_136854 [Neurospora tetrasperma FGSC 2508]|uniref:Uncharacterized protein n=1 Tax=Neurospora tetrasperma (strain FGSC 2508 / ATCC MYA-4615 / P0657) TaxID=510951 RepID=F8MIM0_NEUT8|nr:uncharacterized protein NEUTE1DRAFT_136854 [Neurospora tetrasperma FGSC 2508]EGO59821.1 hypothetical protein NEUTE1DRAFT_136854 [Neurospora tetrasperma FGSC 2508]EGZ73969.1 hypothetical protein NEUTE2DRAFT_166039 [Neurospora tetrasperma FGSC 2509]